MLNALSYDMLWLFFHVETDNKVWGSKLGSNRHALSR